MLCEKTTYTKADISAIEILNSFLPDKIFDAHAHLFDSAFLPNVHPTSCGECTGDLSAYKSAMLPMLCNPKELRLNIITFPDRSMADITSDSCRLADEFLIRQLDLSPNNTGEIMVLPKESAESIERRLIHPSIKGLKCYHTLADEKSTWNLPISAYLPESAWEVASKHKLYITLHMVKDKALADKENMDYICTMVKRYPDVILILAHAARSFAAWTAIESVSHLSPLENVWFDFSGICESPALFMIMQKIGVNRCMWGSDYPICTRHGKAISISDTFHWIYEADCIGNKKLPQRFCLVGIENLMALRQACILAKMPESNIEDLFWNNAIRLFTK